MHTPAISGVYQNDVSKKHLTLTSLWSQLIVGSFWTHPHLHVLRDMPRFRRTDIKLDPAVKMETLARLVRKVRT